MPHTPRNFAKRLNQCFDETGAPAQVRERAMMLSKMLNIPKQQAWGILEGHQLPAPEILQQIASEFEVNPKWLSGDES